MYRMILCINKLKSKFYRMFYTNSALIEYIYSLCVDVSFYIINALVINYKIWTLTDTINELNIFPI